jgi:hypothetical protein
MSPRFRSTIHVCGSQAKACNAEQKEIQGWLIDRRVTKASSSCASNAQTFIFTRSISDIRFAFYDLPGPDV